MDERKVIDYFVTAGLSKDTDKQQLLGEFSLEVNLKPSAYNDPITDITVIFPSLGENLPDYYQLVEETPTGLSANLNHGSFRAPEVFLCYRRSRNRPPLVDIGVLYDGRERVMPDSQLVEFTPNNHCANVNNTSNSATYLTYRRATEVSACNELVVMDICVIIASKGETPPHSFMKIPKNLNKGMMGADVYLCYKKSINRPDLISYKPSLLSRFPLKNNPSYALEENVALFCLPMGATLECWPANSSRSLSVQSTFVLTLANRTKVYGSAITFYEEVDEDTFPLSEQQRKDLGLHKYRRKEERNIFTNKCICVLSQWPFFDAFEKLLFFLHKRQLMGPFDVSLERLVAHFLYDVPFPSPSRPRILIQMSSEETIALSQPEELPLPRSGASFRNLLTNLGPDNCLLVLLLALTEQKILLHSLRPSVLTSVAEAVMQIIFPFYWQCPYIPLCPIGMSDYLAAPLPFIIGLDSRFFDLYDQPSDVNAIDLDTSTVTLCDDKKDLSSKLLPKKAARQLKNSLILLLDKCKQHNQFTHKLQAHMDDAAIDYDFTIKKRELQLELEIREAFLQFSVSILNGYKHFLLPIIKEPSVGATDVHNLFDQTGFLRSRDRNFHKFYVMLMRTQMFTKFIEERSFVSETNTCLAFFDECVDKHNAGDATKFLELEGYDSDRTVFILPPDPKEEDKELFNKEVFELDPARFPNPPETEPDGDTEFFNKAETPSIVARRTKQEIRSAQKLARKHQRSPYLWAKCLINTSYSLWFIHLPGFLLASEAKAKSLRIGFTLLQRMKRLKLFPADEICYRVMMQLCGIYNQPTLAVKVLFEMNGAGMHPNAVTYGYYNKAVLESKWPTNEDSMTRGQALWHRMRLVILATSILWRVSKEGNFLTSKLKSVSTNAVNNQEMNAEKRDDLDGTSQASSEDVCEVEPNMSAEATTEALDKDEMREDDGLHLIDCPGDRDQDDDLGVKVLSSDTETSASKPDEPSTILNNTPTTGAAKGVSRVLFPEKTENDDQSSGNIFADSAPKARLKQRISNIDTNPLQACASTDQTDAKDSTPPSSAPMNDDACFKTPLSKTIGRISSANPLTGTPITENDPLGALSSPEEQSPSHPPGLTKSATLPTVERMKPDDNILGSPFASEPSNRSLQSYGTPSSTSLASSFTSFKSLTKSGASKLSSLKKMSTAYLSPNAATQKKTQEALTSSLASMKSYVNTVSKQVRESVQTTGPGMMSPAGSYQYLSTPDKSQRDDDSMSTASGDSRRPSVDPALLYQNDQSETWSSFTGQLWDQFWGGTGVVGPQEQRSNLPQHISKASEITDKFESLYMNLPKKIPGPEAMQINMTSCSKCLYCFGILFDEEIMSGWTADDSNLNTKCLFCERMVVPFLSITVSDFRNASKEDRMQQDVPEESMAEDAKENTDDADKENRPPSPATPVIPPVVSEDITVPYISPLVLRKELENMLQADGDQCLLNDSFVDSHPIIFWNLLWYYERIAVKSHLPGHCLLAKSLNPDDRVVHPSWLGSDHRNVSICCRWDNVKHHDPADLPLYTRWQTEEQASSSKVVSTAYQNPAYRSVMQHIIVGVKKNDLLSPIKTMLERRESLKQAKDTPEGVPRTPRSIYREILFLTLISLGQDNIDLSAFDREYRKAFERLPSSLDAHVHLCDKPPVIPTIFCRKLFRELKL